MSVGLGRCWIAVRLGALWERPVAGVIRVQGWERPVAGILRAPRDFAGALWLITLASGSVVVAFSGWSSG